MNQKEAVYQATIVVCGENGISIDEGFNACVIPKPLVKTIIGLVAQGLNEGVIELSAESKAKYDTFEKVVKYTNGLVSNWFRKDTRLNGGGKYETKNPGSRTRTNDPQLKALRTLREVHADNADALAEIDAAIAARTAELQAEKVKTVVIDVESLPESLRHLV